MTVKEMIEELSTFPPELEVYIEAWSGADATFDKLVTGVEWNTTGQRNWITITDYKGYKEVK